MKLTYDPRYNVAYIHLKEKTDQVETVRVSDELSVDLAPDGSVYGIEFLDANRQLGTDAAGKLIVINQGSGEISEVNLPA